MRANGAVLSGKVENLLFTLPNLKDSVEKIMDTKEIG